MFDQWETPLGLRASVVVGWAASVYKPLDSETAAQSERIRRSYHTDTAIGVRGRRLSNQPASRPTSRPASVTRSGLSEDNARYPHDHPSVHQPYSIGE